ncbi:MAG: hypothetical protein K2W79_01750 [Hydrotalea flava]|nr:hypothetical protein [Hydrotalea flava]
MNTTICDKDHRHDNKFTSLPHDQGGAGRHRCAGCAYDAGLQRLENLILDLDELHESQAGTVRHKSPHAANAQGYYDGVVASYN